MGTGALSPEVKMPGREADHSPPSTAEIRKKVGPYILSLLLLLLHCVVLN
jgi:hypothetical protein